MRVALVYDRVNKWGGAERVLLSLHELFPDAPLFTSVYHRDKAPWADVFSVSSSYLQTFPYASSSHEYYAVFMPSAFEQFNFDDYDLVISVASESAKGIITKPQTKHICYCLTPTRYLWSGYDEYFSNPILKTLAKPATAYLRAWDKVAAQRPDHIIGISHEVKKRISDYYDRDAAVIYPPVTFKPSALRSSPHRKEPRTDYLLIVSRLVPYKKVDIAIQACNELKIPLVIVGTGSEEKRLRSLAGPTVTLTGSLTDDELAGYYEHCTALLFPGYEDFGLTILEAQSFGKPVVAFGRGGALETVIEGKTGLFFHSQTVGALKKVLREFVPEKFKPADARNQARMFSEERFKREFREAVEAVFR